jgi:hypothetical protein
MKMALIIIIIIIEASAHHVEVPQADPTMIGVVIGLALMSVTLCVVLRLFAK